MPSSKPDNPDAFPLPQNAIRGMTLLDYFAGQALAGILASSKDLPAAPAIACKAFELADEMLVERAARRVI